MKKIFPLLSFLFLQNAMAALKPLNYVADKIAAQNVAAGGLQLENELSFPDGTVVRENLFIHNSSGFLYESSTNARGNVMRWSGSTASRPPESELFFRDGKTLLKDWIALGFASPESLGRREKSDLPPQEDFVKLVRFDGKPQYQIGGRPAEDIPAKAVWVEQDEWHLSKIKFASGQEIEFHKYESFSDTTDFPHEMVYRFDGQEIRSKVLMIRKAAKVPIVKKIGAVDLPPVVQQFYQRFR